MPFFQNFSQAPSGPTYAEKTSSSPWRLQNGDPSTALSTSSNPSRGNSQSQPVIQYALANVPESVQLSIALESEDVPTRPNTPETQDATLSSTSPPSNPPSQNNQSPFVQPSTSSEPAASTTTSSPFQLGSSSAAQSQTQNDPLSSPSSLLQRMGIEMTNQPSPSTSSPFHMGAAQTLSQTNPLYTQPTPSSSGFFGQPSAYRQQSFFPSSTTVQQPFSSYRNGSTPSSNPWSVLESQSRPQPVQSSNLSFSISVPAGDESMHIPIDQSSQLQPQPSPPPPPPPFPFIAPGPVPQYQNTASASPPYMNPDYTTFLGPGLNAAASELGIFHDINQLLALAASIGPLSYPAAHRLLTAASEVHAAAADLLATFPCASQQQQHEGLAQMQYSNSYCEPLLSTSTSAEREVVAISPLNSQSAFWDVVKMDTGKVKPATSSNDRRHHPFRHGRLRSAIVAGPSEVKGKRRAIEVVRRERRRQEEEDWDVQRRSEKERARIESIYAGLQLAQEMQRAYECRQRQLRLSAAEVQDCSLSPTYDLVRTHVRRRGLSKTININSSRRLKQKTAGSFASN